MKRVVLVIVAVLAVAAVAWWGTHSSKHASFESSTVTIVYRVHGTAAVADVTVTSATGTQQRQGLTLPLGDHSKNIDGVTASIPRGQPVSIVAQNAGASGTVECIIVGTGGRVIADNTAQGAYAVATCSGIAG